MTAQLRFAPAIAAVACGLGLLAAAQPAAANFSSAPAPPGLMVASATLAPPIAPAASPGCIVLSSVWVDLSWSPTPSLWASAYQIARSTTNGGPYSVIATVVGQATASYKDTTVSTSTTYYYVIRATKSAWTSTNSAQVSARTRTALCLL